MSLEHLKHNTLHMYMYNTQITAVVFNIIHHLKGCQVELTFDF